MRDAAREIRTRLTNAKALCIALGLNVGRASVSGAMVACPWHQENTPSCSVHVAKDGTLAVRCHACGQTADALGLIAQVRGIDDFREVLRAAAEIANAPGLADEIAREPHNGNGAEPSISGETYDRIWSFALEACEPMGRVAPGVAAYLFARGIYADAEAVGVRGLPRAGKELVATLLATFERTHLEQAQVLRVGFDALDWPDWPLLIPWRDRYGRITCVQRRRLDDETPRYRSPRGRSPRAPFGVELLADALGFLGAEAEVVITEGALDCLARRRIARAQDERAAVIGVYSASSPDVGLPVDLLEGRRIVLSLDRDDAGERACERLYRALHGRVAGFIRERPVGAKDWAAALAGGAA